MKNLKRLLSIALTVILMVAACCSALTANAHPINTFELLTDDPYYAVESDCTQLDLDVEFNVNHTYGFVGGEFLIDLPDELAVEEISIKDIIALDGTTSVSTDVVSIAKKDNKVRFIVDDAKQSCQSITFTIKLNILSPLTEGNRYTISLTTENGAFKDIYSQNDEIIFSISTKSINIHIHDNNGADLTCSVCNKYIGKLTPSTPNKPSLQSKTDTTIILKQIDGYEYMVAGGEWQSSNIFENLTPYKSYTFYQRVAETEKSNASESSVGFTVITKKITDVHTLISVEEILATCTTAGQKAYDICTECGNTYIDGKLETDLIIPAKNHVLLQIEGKDPTCEETGYAAYEYCTECDYTTYEEIAALGHDLKYVPEVPITDCSVDGMAAHQECNNGCGKYFVNDEEVEKSTLVISTEHNLVDVAYKAATCTIDGTKVHKVCLLCGSTFINGDKVDNVIIPAAHTLVQVEAQVPTCTENGWAAYEYCTICEHTTYEEISTLGHTAADAVKENEVAPTCTEAGSYDSVVKCSVCNQEISRETVTVDATGHTLVQVPAKAPTTTEIGWNAYEYCENCDYTTYEELAVLPQTGWVEDGGVWYYYKEDGTMATGWEKVNSKWYYFDEDGVMQTGWLEDGGKWYYLKASGAMATGWVKVNGTWYYMNTSGVMHTGWKQISGIWYYFNANGSMVANTSKTIGGKTYHFNASGACTNP